MVKPNEELTKQTGRMSIDAAITDAPVKKAEPITVRHCDTYDPATRMCSHGADVPETEHRVLDGNR